MDDKGRARGWGSCCLLLGHRVSALFADLWGEMFGSAEIEIASGLLAPWCGGLDVMRCFLWPSELMESLLVGLMVAAQV